VVLVLAAGGHDVQVGLQCPGRADAAQEGSPVARLAGDADQFDLSAPMGMDELEPGIRDG